MVLNILGLILMVMGTLFVFVASVGIVRLPDVLMRLHASAKAGTLGVILIAAAMVCFFPNLSTVTRAGVLIFFLMLTAPVAAHMIGRATYSAGESLGVHLWEGTVVDQIREVRGTSEDPIARPSITQDASKDTS